MAKFAARTALGVKFALLVAAVFAAALAALLLVQRTQRKSLGELLASETRQRAALMARVIELTSQALRDFTQDYAQWDDMVTFVAMPRREWAAINIDPAPKNFALDGIWVLRVDGSLVYATTGDGPAPATMELPVDDATLRSVLAPGKAAHFFVQRPAGVFELYFAPVQPSADTLRQTAPRGWLVAARHWDADQLRLIADVMKCETALVSPTAELPPPEFDRISLHHPLRGPDGTTAAHLLCTTRSEELEIVARDQRAELGLFAAAFVLTAAVVGAFVFRGIVRPLQQLGVSLRSRDTTPLRALLSRTDEIGRLAEAVKTSFHQHAALEEMVEARTRLGRELHDGAIQTIYAAGMNLTGARAVLRRDPAEAERILEDTRAELNVTVKSLRDFIHGLEPEAMPPWTFREAVQSIVTLMQGVRPLAVSLGIDDELAAALTGAERLHLLQITREAVSNSVRHGHAQRLAIHFAREAAGRVLEISDDGVGLDLEKSAAGGHGLQNLAARARELGGELAMMPAKGGGLTVRVVLPGETGLAPRQ